MPKSTKTKRSSKKPKLVEHTRARISSLRARRPHHSFRLTKRRDLPKRPALPGYLRFTASVFRMVFTHKRLFGLLLLLYVVIAMLLIGLTQQDQYQSLSDAFSSLGSDALGGQWDSLTQTVSLFGASVSGGLNDTLGETQQLYVAILSLLTWLVMVWLLRQLVAGDRARLRDGLYNAGAPVIPTLLVTGLVAVQLLPAVIGVTAFSTVTQNAVMTGLESMLFGIGALLLIVLSLYWICSSIFALLIVTLQGTYPMVAIRAAGDIASGRRVSLMLRLLWMALLLLIIWALILIPVLLLDSRVSISWLPLIGISLQLLTGFSLIFGSAYVYLLYRRMIDEPKEV